MIRIEEYIDERDVSPFRRWFDELDQRAAACIAIAIDRLAEGNTSNVKSIEAGVAELRIDRGPGYFGWHGGTVVVLLGGGTKKRQQADIQAALRHWRAFKSRQR